MIESRIRVRKPLGKKHFVDHLATTLDLDVSQQSTVLAPRTLRREHDVDDATAEHLIREPVGLVAEMGSRFRPVSDLRRIHPPQSNTRHRAIAVRHREVQRVTVHHIGHEKRPVMVSSVIIRR